MKRKIIHIDESKCNGCGQCIPNCKEGALKIVNGKAKLVSDVFCDGLISVIKDAIAASGKNIPFHDITIGINGKQL